MHNKNETSTTPADPLAKILELEMEKRLIEEFKRQVNRMFNTNKKQGDPSWDIRNAKLVLKMEKEKEEGDAKDHIG